MLAPGLSNSMVFNSSHIPFSSKVWGKNYHWFPFFPWLFPTFLGTQLVLCSTQLGFSSINFHLKKISLSFFLHPRYCKKSFMPIPSFNGGQGTTFDIFGFGFMKCVTKFLIFNFGGVLIGSLFRTNYVPHNFFIEVMTIWLVLVFFGVTRYSFNFNSLSIIVLVMTLALQRCEAEVKS